MCQRPALRVEGLIQEGKSEDEIKRILLEEFPKPEGDAQH